MLVFSSQWVLAEKTAENHLFALLQEINSLQAGFEQQVRNEQGEVLQQTTGEMLIKRPGKLLWITQTPYQHQVITDGDTLWVYDLDLEQVTQQPFVHSLDQAPALLLSGDLEAISNQFTITNQVDDDQQRFTLTPINEGSVFSSLELRFAGNRLDRLVLSDNFAQRTAIRFTNLSINPPIEDAQFSFVPPEHVDLIINEH